MKLSIVIVNYNVKYFLRQCLDSVYRSSRALSDGTQLEIDVWVVDNDSVDGSMQMVEQEYPQTHVIVNHENVGFARANNQALAQAAASSDLLLLLNPDTVVERETLACCADFMAEHAKCGGLTVKMVDGRGRFLRESKRGFPTPQAAFYKISGLVNLFPHSKRIAAYYMGHVGENEVSEIEIMCGAFLMMRREVYEEIGGLDESYFMYGEDIDYSWRIKLAGWSNYYLPTTHIIHYKGESTKKGSMNYVYTFYNAMSIFVNRYFDGGGARLFRMLLHVAIWFRACLAWLSRVTKKMWLPVVDFVLSYGGFLLIKYIWEPTKGGGHNYYPPEYATFVMPLYVVILLVCGWLHGGYDRPMRTSRMVRGVGIGMLLLLAFYSMLDESQRYSRLLLLLGSLWTMVASVITRTGVEKKTESGDRAKQKSATIVVGQAEETARIRMLYQSLGRSTKGMVETSDSDARHLQDLIRIEHAQEVIFCGRNIDLKNIIDLMAQLRTTGVEYKIAPQEGDYIIGSKSIISPEEIYVSDLDTISTDTCRRTKRTFDMVSAVLLIVLSPILFWPQQRKRSYFADCFAVLSGTKTWVGYTGHRGIFSPSDIMPEASNELHERLMLRYMRHYNTTTDMRILLRNWNRI